jgi:hypothetical protein
VRKHVAVGVWAAIPAVVFGVYELNRWNTEAMFYGDVEHGVGRDDTAYEFATRDWLNTHHDDVLAYGRASCDWLAEQPEVPDVASIDAPSVHMEMNYVRNAGSAVLPVNKHARYIVVNSAWAYLCQDTRDTRASLPPGVEDGND